MKDKTNATPKRGAKDTVFRKVFPLPEYRLALYKSLHPEDKTVTADDIKIISLENIVLNEPYNDLGMLARGKLLILIEAQSTWTINILMRLFLYAAATYQDYIKANGISLYGSKSEILPLPEFYVIYTGKDRDKKPEIISLAKDYFENPNAHIDLTAKVIKGKEKDVVWQYVMFTEVWNDSIKLYGRTREAAVHAINRCIDEGFLSDFFTIYKKEVISDMDVLFDYDYNIKALAKEAAREAAKESAILTTIKAYKKFSQTEEQTTSAIETEFGLSSAQAAELVKANWN